MSDKGDIARLVKVMRYIADTEQIIERHTEVMAALLDLEGKHALLMCLLQIGELLNQVHDADLVKKLEVPKIVAYRNIVAHEYETILLDITYTIISKNLPGMKNIIVEYLKHEPDFPELEKLWRQ